METGLRGKNALITGGSSGIGKGIAQVLAGEGVNLAIASRNPDPAVVEELKKTGVNCIRISADVSRENEVVDMVSTAIKRLGDLDFYVNNAAWTWHQPVTKIDSESWYKTLNTNLSSCVWACREVCKHMIRRGAGSIVIIGSTARFTPLYREASYRISKTGLHVYMENLAIEMAPHGIRVNMVTPGHFKTRMTGNIPQEIEDKLREIIPLQRFGDPKEIGYAVAMLLSDNLSGYSCGTDIIIDGGLTIAPLCLFDRRDINTMNTED